MDFTAMHGNHVKICRNGRMVDIVTDRPKDRLEPHYRMTLRLTPAEVKLLISALEACTEDAD